MQIYIFLTAIWLPMANFGLLSRWQPHSPDVNHYVLHFRPEGHRRPRSEVGSPSPAERLVGFEPGTFRFLLQRLKPLGHSPQYEIIQHYWLWLCFNLNNTKPISCFQCRCERRVLDELTFSF